MYIFNSSSLSEKTEAHLGQTGRFHIKKTYDNILIWDKSKKYTLSSSPFYLTCYLLVYFPPHQAPNGTLYCWQWIGQISA